MKAFYQMQYDLLGKDVKSFAEIKAIGDVAWKKYFPKSEHLSPLMWYSGILNYFGYSNSLKKEYVEVCKNSSNVKPLADCLITFKMNEFGYSDKEIFSLIEKVINGNNFENLSVNKVNKIIDLYIKYANKTNASDADVKACLKKLNRTFTGKLLEDKTKWEPVVAKIRSLLETY